MATSVIMPRQGQSVESCIITKWHKKPGETVAEGDLLFSYETDKASFDEEAKAAGTLLAVFFEEGDDVPCLTSVAAIGNAGEDVSSLRPDGQTPAETPQTAASQSASVQAQPEPLQHNESPRAERTDGKVFVSPRARALAAQIGLDAAAATPTGPSGRVIERDIRALQQTGGAAKAAAPAANAGAPSQEIAYRDEKVPNIRKVIGKSMLASLSQIAQLTLHASFDASSILALRKSIKEAKAALGAPNITLNDMVLFAVSRVIKDHRDLNAHFLGDEMRYFSGVHLGMAVDTPRGLLVPTLFNADQKSLVDISLESKALAKAAQEGTISPDLLRGASFTISNLGGLDIEMFTPVINPPQTGILGLCNMTWRMHEVGGKLVPYQAMGLSLTFDHRALDGAPAARFLQALSAALENFTSLLES